MKVYDYNNLLGCVIQRRSRKTGTLYGVYHGEQSTIDITAKWVTVCEVHSNIVASDTLNSAKQIIKNPDEWCESCRQTLEMDNDTITEEPETKRS